MQTIRITNLRPELTGVLRDLDRPVAITKYGKIVAWLISPSHNSLAAPTAVSPAIDPFECVALPSITSGLPASEFALAEESPPAADTPSPSKVAINPSEATDPFFRDCEWPPKW